MTLYFDFIQTPFCRVQECYWTFNGSCSFSPEKPGTWRCSTRLVW